VPPRSRPPERPDGQGRPHPRQRRPRRRGAQPGNTNALKHGLYSRTLSPYAADLFDTARRLSPTDLTEEIAALRAKLAALSPHQLAAFYSGTSLLARLVAQQHRMSPAQAQNLADAIASTVKELGAALYPQEGQP